MRGGGASQLLCEEGGKAGKHGGGLVSVSWRETGEGEGSLTSVAAAEDRPVVRVRVVETDIEMGGLLVKRNASHVTDQLG